MKRLHLKRLGPGLYESPDGRYEIAYEEYWLEGECECAVCQGYIFGTCPNDGCGKRTGWHIWDREVDDYAIWAHEPQMFETFGRARAAWVEHMATGVATMREP